MTEDQGEKITIIKRLSRSLLRRKDKPTPQEENEEKDVLLCPRAETEPDKPTFFDAETDPAVQEVARKIVAGFDGRYELDAAHYKELTEEYGESEAQRSFYETVRIPGTIAIIQTEMDLGGYGLFGGLSEDASRFNFYEWGAGYGHGEGDEINPGWMTSLTIQEARDIVSGKLKKVKFVPWPIPPKGTSSEEYNKTINELVEKEFGKVPPIVDPNLADTFPPPPFNFPKIEK